MTLGALDAGALTAAGTVGASAVPAVVVAAKTGSLLPETSAAHSTAATSVRFLRLVLIRPPLFEPTRDGVVSSSDRPASRPRRARVELTRERPIAVEGAEVGDRGCWRTW